MEEDTRELLIGICENLRSQWRVLRNLSLEANSTKLALEDDSKNFAHLYVQYYAVEHEGASVKACDIALQEIETFIRKLKGHAN